MKEDKAFIPNYADIGLVHSIIFEALQEHQIDPFHALYAFLLAVVLISRTQSAHIPSEFKQYSEEVMLHGLLDAAIFQCDEQEAGGRQ